jgi:hypothetical protein
MGQTSRSSARSTAEGAHAREAPAGSSAPPRFLDGLRRPVQWATGVLGVRTRTRYASVVRYASGVLAIDRRGQAANGVTNGSAMALCSVVRRLEAADAAFKVVGRVRHREFMCVPVVTSCPLVIEEGVATMRSRRWLARCRHLGCRTVSRQETVNPAGWLPAGFAVQVAAAPAPVMPKIRVSRYGP